MRYALHKRLYLAVILSLLLCSFVTHHVHADSPSAFKTFQLIAFDELSGNPDPFTGDDFGHSVAVSGDTAVVGAPNKNVAYVFKHDGSTWNQVAELTPASAQFPRCFGHAVAISGNTVIVGDPLDSPSLSAPLSGAVYVFTRENNSWDPLPQNPLTAKELEGFLGFGWSLAIENDIILVGTAGGDRAYVFRSDGSTWLEEAKLTATDDGSGTLERFGRSVDVGENMAVVGAPFDSAEVSKSGAAYVFRFDPPDPTALEQEAKWTQKAKLTASDAAANDEFGYSVAVSGDTVVVGAPFSTNEGINPGAAYVFKVVENTWREENKLAASDGSDGDQFGYTIALSGDTVVVGAPFSTHEGINPGAAYVFNFDGSEWVQEGPKLTTSDGSDGDKFGLSTAINGKTFVVGSPLADVVVVDPNDPIQNLMVPDAGAAYAFILPPANQDPAAIFEFTRAKVDWKKGKIKLDGQVVLPEGVTYEYLDRKGSVKLSFELNQPV